MSKKIIIVGPSGAGKTTLRKVFFEGENSTKLMEYALEPTYGEESLIFRLPGLNEDLGIFDLAGQENQRWLDSEEKSIFNETKVILVVIDIKTELDFIIDFIEKILKIRKEITPSTMVYVLIHKLDLASEKRIKDVKTTVKQAFEDEGLIKIFFTSLKKQFFIQTFSFFIEILKNCIDERTSEKGLEFNVIDESVKIVNYINNEITISKKKIIEKLNRPEKLINYLIENLVNKGHIQMQKIENSEIFSLTDIGKDYFKNVIKSFSSSIIKEETSEEKIPLFIGAFIADKDGKSLFNIEIFENALEKYILSNRSEDAYVSFVDLDLFPMFVSALEKFALELNLQELKGFSLTGKNLKMHIFGYEDYTVTFFLNPNINLKPIETIIENYFKNLFQTYDTDFKYSMKTGQIDNLFPIIEEGKKWLQELNGKYEEMIINLDIYDIEHAKDLYDKIDDLFNKVNVQFSITLEKIKKLKVNLMKAILEKDFDELKKNAKIAQSLSSKFTV